MKKSVPNLLFRGVMYTLVSLSFQLLFIQMVSATTLNTHRASAISGNNPVTMDIVDNYIDITGTVLDQSGEPIPGATVIVEGTNVGTVTDVAGNFSINVDVGAIIRFSFIGYESQRITVGNQTQLNITLQED